MPVKVTNNVKEKLARDEVVLSMTARLVRSIEIARIARTAGYDTLYVDLEHSSFSLDTTGQICMAALEVGITPFVRVPDANPKFISRVLDGGAMGIIVPHIRSAQEAREVVAAAKYPPVGDRSYAYSLPHLQFRAVGAEEASQALNDATTVVVMLETTEALQHVEEIAAVEGLNILLIGTNDLCSELGIPGQYGHELVQDAYTQTIAACRRHCKHVGIGGLAAHPELVYKFIRQGARYVSVGADLDLLLAAASQKVQQLRNIE